MTSNVLTTNRRPVRHKLQIARKEVFKTQTDFGKSAGVCASTVSKAENGKNVSFTSAILILTRLHKVPYGTYDLNDREIRRIVGSYLRATNKGRHAKGWKEYVEPAAQAEAA